MKIYEVKFKSDFKKFINLPYLLYQNNSDWIPPLRLDQKNVFNPKKNSVLNHCEYQLFILYENSKIVGRIVAYVNHVANEYWHEKIGFFGHYECIDDQRAASLLLKTAERWLLDRGIKKMRGQWNFVSQDIGFIYEGFDIPPIILSSYNPPYYKNQMDDYGMQKAKDLLVYSCDMTKGYKIPNRFLEFTNRIAERYRVTIRPINMKNVIEDARIIVRLTNESIADNWGFYPVDETEANQIAADLKMIVHPEVILIAEIDGEPNRLRHNVARCKLYFKRYEWQVISIRYF